MFDDALPTVTSSLVYGIHFLVVVIAEVTVGNAMCIYGISPPKDLTKTMYVCSGCYGRGHIV